LALFASLSIIANYHLPLSGALAVFMKLITFIIVLLCTSCSDVVTDHYPTYQDAKNARLFLRGWLPDILPLTTINISTSNELDLNTSEGSFEIPVKYLPKFISHLTEKSGNKYAYKNSESHWEFTINSKTGYVSYVLRSHTANKPFKQDF
jgi:hypothetical protein